MSSPVLHLNLRTPNVLMSRLHRTSHPPKTFSNHGSTHSCASPFRTSSQPRSGQHMPALSCPHPSHLSFQPHPGPPAAPAAAAAALLRPRWCSRWRRPRHDRARSTRRWSARDDARDPGDPGHRHARDQTGVAIVGVVGGVGVTSVENGDWRLKGGSFWSKSPRPFSGICPPLS